MSREYLPTPDEATTNGPPGWETLVEDGSIIQTRDLPAIVEIVEGILPEACKLLIGSGAKSFKTWLTIHMLLCISHGIPFLGRVTQRRRVIYCNLELRPKTFERRLQCVAKALRLTIEPEWFYHLPLRGKLSNLKPGEVITRIIRITKERQAECVALDPLYKLNAGKDENSVGDQTVLLNDIDRLTTEANSAVVINDHFSKGNQSEKDPLDAIRGSSAKGGDVDAALVLRQHIIENCFRVDVVHRELPPVDPFVLHWKFPLMQSREDLNPDEMKRAKGGRPKEHDPKDVLTAIIKTSAKKPTTISAWAIAAAIPRKTIVGYLPGFRVKGWIATVGEGNSARQHITKEGKEYVKKGGGNTVSASSSQQSGGNP